MELIWLIFLIFLGSIIGFCAAAALAVSIIRQLKKENRELTAEVINKKELLGEYKEAT